MMQIHQKSYGVTPTTKDEIQEQIVDHIMDRYLTPEMENAGIDGEDLGDLAWEVTVELLPLQD